ncbi:MAG: hypothetical protein AB7I27_04365 [Bacteriovoracaceae bacterium]
MDLKILSIIEEQVAVAFTGKINVLSKLNRQFLGHLLFKNGEIINAHYQGISGLKAFYKIIIEEFSLIAFEYVVEPEVVNEKEQQIYYSYTILKNKLSEVIKLYHSSLKLRPPSDVRIILGPEIIKEKVQVTSEEFEVMTTLSEWSLAHDVYQHCQLLDHEITLALVNLRKKGALKIIATKNNGST